MTVGTLPLVWFAGALFQLAWGMKPADSTTVSDLPASVLFPGKLIPMDAACTVASPPDATSRPRHNVAIISWHFFFMIRFHLSLLLKEFFLSSCSSLESPL
jgi:hypothetical protein